MPSPVGHALAGLATVGLASERPGWRILTALAVVGMLPDVDFLLPLQHRGPSHSLTAAGLAFAGALAVVSWREEPVRRVRLAMMVGLAYLSHSVLDWLGEDTWTPMGIMALWPFSNAFYVSGLDLFKAVDRRYWMPGFWGRNGVALLREIAILAPILILSMYRSRVRFFDRADRRRPSA